MKLIGKVYNEELDCMVEREFTNVKDAIKSDYKLYKNFKQSYDLYFDGKKLDRDEDMSFEDELRYLSNQVNSIKIARRNLDLQG